MGRTVAVTPIIGEFGYVIFDVQPRVRAWLRQNAAATRRVVVAPRELSVLFEEATEVIEPPAHLLPTAPATMRSIVYEHWRSGDPERIKIEQLVAWAKSTIEADEWLEIPYFCGSPWAAPATHVKLEGTVGRAPAEPYLVVAARARAFDAWRNWPKAHWDELVGRIRQEWRLDVRCIGRPPSTYFPTNAIPQDVDDVHRLDDSLSLLNNAVCSVSSNSGPTHLSLMAGCPTFAWGEPYLKPFMESHTNPLGTPCQFIPGGWDPSVDRIWAGLKSWRASMERQGTWREGGQQRPKITMCMIARDAETTIRPALESIRPWVDEMVVVDTGSNDQTAAVAEACGARVAHAPWQDSFAAARNESLRHANGEWIFWMDADDVIDESNGPRLRDLVSGRHCPSTMGYVVQVRCPSGEGTYQTPTVVDHVKLFRNLPAVLFTGRIHEQVLPSIRNLGCDIAWTDICVTHANSDRTESGRVKKQARDLRLLEMELNDDPDNSFTLFNIGMTLLDAGEPSKALDALCRALQLADPGDSHVRKLYSLLVQAYAQLGRTNTALNSCQRGLALYPDDVELAFRAGVFCQALGRSDEAERCFVRLLNSTPGRYLSSFDRGILGVKAWHNLAVVYESKREYANAADAWRQVLTIDSNSESAWRGLVDALATVRDEAALAGLLSPSEFAHVPNPIRCLGEAKLLELRGDARAAVRRLRGEAGTADIDDNMLDALCEISFRNGLWDDAIVGLEELILRRPKDASAFQNLAAAYLRRHNYQKSADSVRKSLSIRPNHPDARALLATTLACIRNSNPSMNRLVVKALTTGGTDVEY